MDSQARPEINNQLATIPSGPDTENQKPPIPPPVLPPPYRKKKGSRKLVIVLVVIGIVVLSSIGIGLYFFLNRDFVTYPQTVTMEAEGGTCSFQIEGPSDWQMLSNPKSWLYYTRDDQTLIFNVNENSGYQRGDTLVIGNSRKSCTIVILQESGVFTSDQASKHVEGGGGTEYFYISGQKDWYIEENTEDWGSASRDGNSLKWTVSENMGEPREDAIIIAAGKKRLMLRIYQDGALTLSTTDITMGSGSSKRTITVTGPSSWSCRPDTYWIEAENSDNRLVIKVDANDDTSSREGTVTVSGGGQSVTVKVVQNGKSSYSGGGYWPWWGY